MFSLMLKALDTEHWLNNREPVHTKYLINFQTHWGLRQWFPSSPSFAKTFRHHPTLVFFGSWEGSADRAGPPFSQTSWSWHSGSGPLRHPLSAAGNGGCLRFENHMSALSRRLKRRCWRHHQNTYQVIRTFASVASSVEERRTQKMCKANTVIS